jgi:hypothetical protein
MGKNQRPSGEERRKAFLRTIKQIAGKQQSGDSRKQDK